VDTYKLDFHASYVTQAQTTGATIIAFDMPGTAELREVGLSGVVDACVDNGGPVRDSFTADHIGKLPFGMFDIVANAVGYDAKPTLDRLVSDVKTLSRAALLERQTNCPMYIINGADDYFVAKSDTLVFQGRTNTEVHLLEGTAS
jgi:esterase FrsA